MADVLTLSSGYGEMKKTPHQKKFARASRICRGDSACMSRELSGSGKGIWKKAYSKAGYDWSRCKSFKATGTACEKIRCAPKGKRGSKTPSAARAACMRRKKSKRRSRRG